MVIPLKNGLNKYVIFDTEMRAIRAWLNEVSDSIDPGAFYAFAETYMKLDLTGYSLHDRPPLSRTEQIKYLDNIGLPPTNIAKRLKASPITVNKVLEDDRNVRFYRDNPALDSLIEQWQPIRPFFPDEIFIKYLE